MKNIKTRIAAALAIVGLALGVVGFAAQPAEPAVDIEEARGSNWQ